MWQEAVLEAVLLCGSSCPFPAISSREEPRPCISRGSLCIKIFLVFFHRRRDTWRLCGPVCLSNDPGPFLCLLLQEETLSLFPLCDPRHSYALWHGLTQEVQAMTPETSFLFLEEHSRLTVFSEDQTSLLSCQCLELKVELMF